MKLEGNTGVNQHDFGLYNGFLRVTQKSQQEIIRINTLDLIKTQNFKKYFICTLFWRE